MNLVAITGRLTAEPELKTTNSGISVSSFTVAVDRAFTKEKQTDFINCVAWRNTAEFITRYFSKGQMIAIKGSLHQRNFEDKNGNKRTAFDVVVESAEFCGSKQEKSEPNINYADVNTSDFDELSDQDLPF